MDKAKLYKIAGPAIKLLIIIVAFSFLFYKIFFRKDISGIFEFFKSLINSDRLHLFIISFMLMFLNWGTELAKWRFLIKRIERISFISSVVAIFSGITISSITPNRVGEYGGRVFVLSPGNRWQGVVLTIVGSISQLITTLCMGIISLLLFYPYFNLSDSLEFVLVFASVFAFFLLLTFYFNVSVLLRIINKIKWLTPVMKYVSVLKKMNTADLLFVLLYSILRHLIFSFQFFLLFRFAGLHIEIYHSFVVTSIIFLILAAIPTIALSEFGVRGSVTIFIFTQFFQHTSYDTQLLSLQVVSAAFLLWIINLAIPAVLGSFFILKLKFFNHS